MVFLLRLLQVLPARFAVVPLAIWSCVWASEQSEKRWPAILAGGLCGIGVIFQTDTGVILLVAGTAFFLALVTLGRRPILLSVSFAVSAAASFAILAILIVGPGKHLILLPWRMVEPILLYSGGFGGVKLQWDNSWTYFYNIFVPALLFASIAMALLQMRRSSRSSERSGDRLSYILFLLAAFAYLALTKLVNRSIDVVWWLNGWAALFVVIIWIRAAIDPPVRWSNLAGTRRSALVCASVLALCTITFVDAHRSIIHGLSRSPAVRWFYYFSGYPSVAL